MTAPISKSRFAAPQPFYTPLLVLQQRPAPPRLWLLLLVLLSLAGAAIAWTIYGSLEIVVTGRGRIVPVGDSRVVQASESGAVSAILVREGDAVAAGQLLVTLDKTERDAELTRLRETRAVQMRDAQRIGELIKIIDSGAASVEHADLGSSDSNDETLVRMRTRFASHMAKREALLAQEAQQRAIRLGQEANIQHHTKMLPFLMERQKDLRALITGGNTQKATLIEAETKVLESENALQTGAAQIDQSLATSAEIASKLADLNAEMKTQLYDDLAATRLKLIDTEQQLVQAARRLELMEIRAPARGTLNRLSINTIGAMVSPGQLIATIIPPDEALEALINFSSRDIGYVSEKQDVILKVDAFPYSRHGYVRATIDQISPEALLGAELTPAELLESGTRQTDPSDPFKRSYTARVKLNRSELSSAGIELRLRPGMTIVADTITGYRKVYEYLFTSRVERMHEFARER